MLCRCCREHEEIVVSHIFGSCLSPSVTSLKAELGFRDSMMTQKKAYIFVKGSIAAFG